MADASRKRQGTLELSRVDECGISHEGSHCNVDMKRNRSQKIDGMRP